MSGRAYIRSEVEPLLAEFKAHMESEARRRLVAHAAELKEIVDRDGYRAFCSRWYDLINAIMADLEAEMRERLREIEVAGSA